jgi:hypothetical protein
MSILIAETPTSDALAQEARQQQTVRVWAQTHQQAVPQAQEVAELLAAHLNDHTQQQHRQRQCQRAQAHLASSQYPHTRSGRMEYPQIESTSAWLKVE